MRPVYSRRDAMAKERIRVAQSSVVRSESRRPTELAHTVAGLRRVARGLSALLLVTLASVTPAPAAQRAVDPAPYFSAADYSAPKLSPSGRYVGALIPAQGRRRLAVIDLDARTSSVAAAIDGEDVVSFDWVNDNRLVFTVGDMQAPSGEWQGSGLFAVNRDGTLFRRLTPTAKAQRDRGQRVYRYVRLHATLDDGSDDVLVAANEPNANLPSLYRMDTTTGRKRLVTFDAPGAVVRWVTDANGAVRAAVTDEKSLLSRVWWRPAADAKWVELGAFRLGAPRFEPIGFDGDGTLVVWSNLGRDTAAIYRYDTVARAPGELLAAHPEADLMGGLVFDRARGRIAGVDYDGPLPGAMWLDPEWAALQRAIDEALPAHRNVFVRRGARALVYSYSDVDPGVYYVYDIAGRGLEPLGVARRAIDPAAMPARKPVRYTARDGLAIPGYLTLPKGREAKSLPLVVLVHGGPYMRGARWRWSAEPAYLAALGYAVLEPEFRGSTGWGAKLQGAGWKAWGTTMQDDLVDGVDWLAREGIVDPKRACLMGASYGGYAVLMGLARDPERWRCGIDMVGVTDIGLLFDLAWADYAYSDWIRYAAREMIGDPERDAARFAAASPLANAAKIKAPVLMAYGAQDLRVPLVHGEKMRDALLRAGTPVEWVAYPEEGHGFALTANRMDYYRRVARFLGAHNPAE